MAFDGTIVRPLRDEDASARPSVASRRRPMATGRALWCCASCTATSIPPTSGRPRVVAEALPGWFVCTSQEVLPELREYERFSTAALNAYIGPTVGGYLDGLGRALAGHGYGGRVFITTSSGGIMTSAVAARFPVHTVLSGPAGGVAARGEPRPAHRASRPRHLRHGRDQHGCVPRGESRADAHDRAAHCRSPQPDAADRDQFHRRGRGHRLARRGRRSASGLEARAPRRGRRATGAAERSRPSPTPT